MTIEQLKISNLENQVRELRETIHIQGQQIERLERLIVIKDQKIEFLSAKNQNLQENN